MRLSKKDKGDLMWIVGELIRNLRQFKGSWAGGTIGQDYPSEIRKVRVKQIQEDIDKAVGIKERLEK